MKFMCLVCLDRDSAASMTEDDWRIIDRDSLGYDDVLREGGHSIGGEALQSARNAKTVRFQNGEVIVTDGPYAETKEQVGGFFMLEAEDLQHAIQLVSKHPGVKVGPFEIRPVEDMTEMVRESERRRSKTVGR